LRTLARRGGAGRLRDSEAAACPASPRSGAFRRASRSARRAPFSWRWSTGSAGLYR